MTAIAAAMLVLAMFVSEGFFSGDEAIYYMGAHAVLASGDFAVQNGYEVFGSDDLKLWLLIDGPSGLVPQYPAGSAVVGALLLPVFGQAALIALNLAAAIGTLFATHALTRRLFGSTEVANIAVILLAAGTFWMEYAFGHWPHSTSVFFTTCALLLLLKALERHDGAWLPALWSGLAVGAGLVFRLDGVLILPAIAAATILYAARPWQVFAGGAAGLVPALIALAVANSIKFGTWNPISYGSQGGGTDPTSHLGVGIAMLVVLAGLVALRRFGTIAARTRRTLAAGVVLAVAALALTPAAPALWKFAAGADSLLLDATAIVDPRPGVVAQPDGSVLFYGIPKKALGQSLPWLGLLALLVGLGWGDRRRSVVIVLLFVAVWTAPFLMRSWHGGLSSNMRYFLPLLPAIAALAGWLLHLLLQRAGAPRQAWRLALLGGMAGIALAVLWPSLAPGHDALLHQTAATWVLYAIAATSLAAGFIARPAMAGAAVLAVGAGLGLGAYLSLSDFATAQAQRAVSVAHSTANLALPDRALIYGWPERYAGANRNPDQFLALPDRITGAVDAALIEAACAAGYRVLMPPDLAATVPGRAARGALVDTGADPLAEIACD